MDTTIRTGVHFRLFYILALRFLAARFRRCPVPYADRRQWQPGNRKFILRAVRYEQRESRKRRKKNMCSRAKVLQIASLVTVELVSRRFRKTHYRPIHVRQPCKCRKFQVCAFKSWSNLNLWETYECYN